MKKKYTQKALSLVLAGSIVFNLFSAIGSFGMQAEAAVTRATNIQQTNGTVSWSLQDGHLKIWGTGDPVWDENGVTWHDFKDEVISAEVDLTGSTDLSYMFAYFTNLETVDLSGLDTSTVINMSCMFEDCKNLKNLDVSGFDTSNTKYMGCMFKGCESLTYLDVSEFDTSNVTSMDDMFAGCGSLTSLDVSGFDTSDVVTMQRMFQFCDELTALDVSGFDTSSAERMDAMFNGCAMLTELDVSGFDTAKVTDMQGMFHGLNSVTYLDVSGFDTSKVTDMNYMFADCWELRSLDVSGFDTSSVMNMDTMFGHCGSLTNLDVSNFDTRNVTCMQGMFYGCAMLTELDVSGFDTSNVSSINYMFADCLNLTNLDVSSFDISKLTSLEGMFYCCRKLQSVDISNFDTSMVETMSNMFSCCENLLQIDVSSFNTENLKWMSYMFSECYSVKTLDLSNFDLSAIEEAWTIENILFRMTSLESVYAPLGLAYDTVELPREMGEMWLDSEGNRYRCLPTFLEESILLTRTTIPLCDEHEYGDWIVEVEATLAKEGLKYKECFVCEHRLYEIIPCLEAESMTEEQWGRVFESMALALGWTQEEFSESEAVSADMAMCFLRFMDEFEPFLSASEDCYCYAMTFAELIDLVDTYFANYDADEIRAWMDGWNTYDPEEDKYYFNMDYGHGSWAELENIEKDETSYYLTGTLCWEESLESKVQVVVSKTDDGYKIVSCRDLTEHTYDAPVFVWEEDFSGCTATFTCAICEGEKIFDCEITSVRACIGTIYKATVEFQGKTYTHEKVDPARPGGAETNAPVIHWLEIDKTEIGVGETVTYTAQVTDESELESVAVKIRTPKAGASNYEYVFLTLDEDGLYRGTLQTDETYANGEYRVEYISARDVLNNYVQTLYWFDDIYFWLYGSDVETYAPVIHWLEIDKKEIEVGDTVTLTMKVTDESDIAYASVCFTTPKAGGVDHEYVYLTLCEDGLFRGSIQTDETFVNGLYTVYWVAARDVYDNSELLAEYESVYFELNGSATEKNAPEIEWIEIDKTEINVGDSIGVTAKVTDESDLQKVYVVFVTPKAGGIDYKYVYMSLGEDGLYHGSLTTDETYAYGRYNSVRVVAIDEHDNRTDWVWYKELYFDIVWEGFAHVFDEGAVTSEPTCQEEGVKTYSCIYCDMTEKEAIPTVDHKYEDGKCIWCGKNEFENPGEDLPEEPGDEPEDDPSDEPTDNPAKPSWGDKLKEWFDKIHNSMKPETPSKPTNRPTICDLIGKIFDRWKEAHKINRGLSVVR